MADYVILSLLKEDDLPHCLIIYLFNTQNCFNSQKQPCGLNQVCEILHIPGSFIFQDLEIENSKYPLKN